MDKKLYDTLRAGLDAAEAMHRENLNPTTNLAGQWTLFDGWLKAVHKAKRALSKHQPETGS